MSDPYSRALNRQKRLLAKYTPTRGGLTQADRELLPYIDEAKKQKTEERSALQPLQVIFDILQTGNYASAGLVDEVWKAIDEKKPFPEWVKKGLEGAWEGLTWEKKRTYSDVLRSRLSEKDTEKYGKGMKLGSWETSISPIDVAGFIGDVLLDPTTYLGFGATKAAKEAAEAVAKDSVRLFAKEYGPEAFQKLIKKNADDVAEQLSKAYAKGGKDAAKKVLGKKHTQFSRQLSDVYDDAYRRALTGRGADVQADLLKRAQDITVKQGYTDIVPKGRDAITDLLNSDVGLGGLIKKLSTETPYEKLGERGSSFAGMEFGKSIRDPNVISQSLSAVKQYIKATPTGRKFSDAWWAINTSGPIGAIREAIGIRNPYQKAINAILRNDDPMANALMSDIMLEGKKIFEGLDDEGIDTVDKIYRAAETAQKSMTGVKVTPADILANPGKYNITIKDPQAVNAAVEALEAWNGKNLKTLRALDAEGLVNAPEELNAYIRSLYPEAAPRSAPRNLGATPTIYQHRQVTRADAVEQAVERMKFLYGFNDNQARAAVENMNVGAFSTDIQESIIARAVVQAKIESKAAMKRQLREFGIKIDDLSDAGFFKNANLMDLQEAGLFTVGDKAFEGYLFDGQVKKIIDNFTAATDPGQVGALRQALSTWTGWWKGTALLGPHTKIRNFIDNNMTLYLVQGIKAFDIREDATAIAMAIHASGMTKPDKLLKEFGMQPGMWNRLLAKPIFTEASGKVWTARDVANIARRTGVFSERTMGYTLSSTIEKFQGKAQSNIAFRASHAVDEIVENVARLKNFNMTLKDLLPEAAGQGTIKQAIEYATKETKKMFIDYGDLTEMERKVFKNIIPFWTFVRQNIANKLHAVIAMPDTLSMFPKLAELAQIEDPEYDPALIPDYMKNLGMIPAIKNDKGLIGMFNPGLSIADLNKLPLVFEKGHALPKLDWNEFKEDLLASAHPLLKTFAEMVPEKGYDSFRKRDIMETSRAPYTFRFIARAPLLLPLLDGVMKWIGFEDGIKAGVNEEGQLVIDGKMARIMESNLPILRHIDMLLMGATALGERAVEGFEQAVEGATGAKTDYDGLEKFFSLLAYYTGAKFKPTDMKALKDQLKKDVYYSARDARTKDIRKTQESVERSRKYRQMLEGKVKRIVR